MKLHLCKRFSGGYAHPSRFTTLSHASTGSRSLRFMRPVEEDLAMEVGYLRAHEATMRELSGWLDMRQSRLNTLIDIIVQGDGELS